MSQPQFITCGISHDKKKVLKVNLFIVHKYTHTHTHIPHIQIIEAISSNLHFLSFHYLGGDGIVTSIGYLRMSSSTHRDILLCLIRYWPIWLVKANCQKDFILARCQMVYRQTTSITRILRFGRLKYPVDTNKAGAWISSLYHLLHLK